MRARLIKSTLSPGRWSNSTVCARIKPTARSIRAHQPSRTRLVVQMVEGHGCHRVGHAHRQLLVGHAFECSSPNGRFTAGAAAINQQVLVRIEVIGKNLFYFFGPTQDPQDATAVLHIHFGMSGAFKVLSLPGPPPRDTTRLAMLNTELGLVCHLSAMTVVLGPLSLYAEKAAKLGPDPLREDADKELLWASLQRCKKPIGLVLMSQELVAGIGNIYRAEILFKSGVHPEQPARSIDRRSFETLWLHCVSLLQRGFTSGSILTVDPDEAKVLGKPWTRRYVYNQDTCGRCRSAVQVWDMAGRKVYCCPTCQPLVPAPGSLPPAAQAAVQGIVTPAPSGRKRRASPSPLSPAAAAAAAGLTELTDMLSPARQAALKAASRAQPFRSHCAPDAASSLPPSKMTVAELKAKLGPQARGTKAMLVAQLEEALALALAQAQAETEDDEAAVVVPASPGLETDLTQVVLRGELLPGNGGRCTATGVPGVVPGTAGLVAAMASAKDAALEKEGAREGRNVEHVALGDDETEALVARSAKSKRRKPDPLQSAGASGPRLRSRARTSTQ